MFRDPKGHRCTGDETVLTIRILNTEVHPLFFLSTHATMNTMSSAKVEVVPCFEYPRTYSIGNNVYGILFAVYGECHNLRKIEDVLNRQCRVVNLANLLHPHSNELSQRVGWHVGMYTAQHRQKNVKRKDLAV